MPGQFIAMWCLSGSSQEHLQSGMFSSAQLQWLNCRHQCTASVAISGSQLSVLQNHLEISGSVSGLLEGFKIRTRMQALALKYRFKKWKINFQLCPQHKDTDTSLAVTARNANELCRLLNITIVGIFLSYKIIKYEKDQPASPRVLSLVEKNFHH